MQKSEKGGTGDQVGQASRKAQSNHPSALWRDCLFFFWLIFVCHLALKLQECGSTALALWFINSIPSHKPIKQKHLCLLKRKQWRASFTSEVEREAGRYRKVLVSSFLFTFVWIWPGGRASGEKDPGDKVSAGRKLRSPWHLCWRKCRGDTMNTMAGPGRKAPQHSREDKIPCCHRGSPSTGLWSGTLCSITSMNIIAVVTVRAFMKPNTVV